MNKTILRGRLAKDLTVSYTKDGKTCASGTICVPNYEFGRNSEGNYDTDFIRFAVFGKNAVTMTKYLAAGMECILEGRLSSSTYEKDSVTHWVTELVVNTFEFVGPKKSDDTSDKKDSKKSK